MEEKFYARPDESGGIFFDDELDIADNGKVGWDVILDLFFHEYGYRHRDVLDLTYSQIRSLLRAMSKRRYTRMKEELYNAKVASSSDKEGFSEYEEALTRLATDVDTDTENPEGMGF